jgi:pimeloyl-ACP methyl ester carboxylesterase
MPTGHTGRAQNFLAMLTFVRNEGVDLCVERRGTGAQHVLFLHGWISARRMWYDVVERLDRSRFTLHLLDFRGCGASDRPGTGHDLAGYVSDARAALASIQAPALVVGHSMGGKVAQFLASERDRNMQQLVLVASGTAYAGRSSSAQREAALSTYGSRERIERFQRAAMRAQIPDSSMQRIVEDALVAQFAHWAGWYDAGRFVDFHERLAGIAIPALCLAGAGDPLIPPVRARREVAQSIAGCLFVTLRTVGHNLPVEAPDEIAGAIARFA